MADDDPKPTPKEEEFFQKFPWLRANWEKEQRKLAADKLAKEERQKKADAFRRERQEKEERWQRLYGTKREKPTGAKGPKRTRKKKPFDERDINRSYTGQFEYLEYIEDLPEKRVKKPRHTVEDRAEDARRARAEAAMAQAAAGSAPTTREEQTRASEAFRQKLKDDQRKAMLIKARAKRKAKREWIERMHLEGRALRGADKIAKAARRAARKAVKVPPVMSWELKKLAQARIEALGSQGMASAANAVIDKINRRVQMRVERAQTLAARATSRAKAMNGGSTSYTWTSQRDSRVRPLHKQLDGQIFTYTSGHSAEGHPGQPYGCRCFAVPVMPVHRAADVYLPGHRERLVAAGLM